MFQAYLGINPATQKPVKTTRRGFKTKKEAQLELNRLLVDFKKNGLSKHNNETFEEIYLLWLETYKTSVKEVTLLKTEIKFNKWILPIYGKLIMKNVTVKYAQEVINEWYKQTNQYKSLHATASRIFAYAVNLGLIDSNPLGKVILPKKKAKKQEKKVKVYSKDELKQLFSFLESQPNSYKNDFNRTLIRTMLYSGARVSELLALEWSDISFDDNTISISKTLSQTENGYKVESPKNESSYGTIAIDQQTILALKKWQVSRRKYMLSVGITNPTNVFCGIYKQVVTHHATYTRLKTITEKSGIPFLGNHSFRHTCASMLLDS